MNPSDHSGKVPSDDVAVFVREWHGVAATLVDRHLTVSGSSLLADALFPTLLPGANLAREMFLRVIPGGTYPCTDDLSLQVVAALHASLARNSDDPEFERVVGELSAMSREFSTAWAAERERLRAHGVVRAVHPAAGDLSIRYRLLELGGGSTDVLIVWQGADPESQSALDRLALAC